MFPWRRHHTHLDIYFLDGASLAGASPDSAWNRKCFRICIDNCLKSIVLISKSFQQISRMLAPPAKVTTLLASVANYQNIIFSCNKIFNIHLQQFLLLESLSLFSTLSALLHLHTAGLSLKNIFSYEMVTQNGINY